MKYVGFNKIQEDKNLHIDLRSGSLQVYTYSISEGVENKFKSDFNDNATYVAAAELWYGREVLYNFAALLKKCK